MDRLAAIGSHFLDPAVVSHRCVNALIGYTHLVLKVSREKCHSPAWSNVPVTPALRETRAGELRQEDCYEASLGDIV